MVLADIDPRKSAYRKWSAGDEALIATCAAYTIFGIFPAFPGLRPPRHPCDEDLSLGTPGFHPSDEDLSPGAPGFHPSDEDLSLGAPGFHPSDEDLSLGTPGLADFTLGYFRCLATGGMACWAGLWWLCRVRDLWILIGVCVGVETPTYRSVLVLGRSMHGLNRLRKKAGIYAKCPKCLPQGLKPNDELIAFISLRPRGYPGHALVTEPSETDL